MEDKRRNHIVSLVLLLVLVVVYVFIFSPIKTKNENLSANVESLTQEVAQKTEVMPDVDEPGLDVGEIEQERLALSIPDRFDQDALIEQLSKLASQNNVKLEALSFNRSTTENAFIDRVQMGMSVSGGLFNALEFLHDLEAQERFYNIETFTLTIGEEEPRQVNFSLNMEVYHS